MCDFGLAAYATQPLKAGTGGTPGYLPPEEYIGTPSAPARASTAGDMFAVGVIAFILLAGYHPFDPEVHVATCAPAQCNVRADTCGPANPIAAFIRQGVLSGEEIAEKVRDKAWSFGEPCWRHVSAAAKRTISALLECAHAAPPARRPSATARVRAPSSCPLPQERSAASSKRDGAP